MGYFIVFFEVVFIIFILFLNLIACVASIGIAKKIDVDKEIYSLTPTFFKRRNKNGYKKD